MRANPPESQAAPPPIPGSTFHTLGTALEFSSDGGVGPADHPEGASASEERQQQMPLPFSGGRKPAPCFARIDTGVGSRRRIG